MAQRIDATSPSFRRGPRPSVSALVLVVSLAVPAIAQPGPEGHEGHHPEASPASSETQGSSSNTSTGHGEGGMGAMMERMGVPPPRELYPEMMRLEGLTPERRNDLLRRAERRRAEGSSRLSDGLEELDRALDEDDRPRLVEAVSEVRAGLDELESGLATEHALRAGREPRLVALDWFRDRMRLSAETPSHRSGPLGLGWFHAFVMALLTAFAGAMAFMYFHKMRRAAALLKNLAGGAVETPADPAPAPLPPLQDAGAQRSDPPGGTTACDALRKTGSCAGCKNPCSTRFRVSGVFQETPGVKTFRLAHRDGGPLPFDYLPGQFLNVQVPAGDGGKWVKRSYTIASSPTQAAFCEISVKRDPEGVVSRYLHDKLRPGDELRIAAPYGRFTFTGDEDESIVLIGGGIGITPLMSVVRYLTDRGWGGEIVLFFGFRTPADFVFREELDRLSRRHDNLRVVATASRPEGSDWKGRAGRIGPDLVREIVPDVAGRRVHLCGPRPMMDTTREFLLELGVAPDRIRFESFGPAAPTPVAEPLERTEVAGAPTVTFSRSGRAAPLPAYSTILDVADAIGVEIEWSCRSGTCGSCAVKLLSGEVTMEVDDGLDAEDREAGLILACQARATADVEVEA